MNTLALQASDEVTATDLGGQFSIWLARSEATHTVSPDGLSIFVKRDGVVAIDAHRAVRLIRAGLRAGHVWELVKLFGLSSKEELLRVLNASDSSIRRWAREDKLMPTPIAEKILRTMQMQLIATDVFGGVGPARVWLRRPHAMLDGLAPADYAGNEFTAGKVRGMLATLQYGGVL